MKSNSIQRFALTISMLLITLLIIWSDQAMAGVLALPQFESKEERIKLERQALQGSREAADKIVKNLLLSSSRSKLYWATIAAENESRNGAYNLGSTIADVGTKDAESYGDFKRDREWYWFNKTAAEGDAEAAYVLKLKFPQPNGMKPEPENEIKQWVLSIKTLPAFKRAAMRGSSEAAFQVYKHYSEVSPKSKELLFWAAIAAQNGHPDAPYILGKLLLKTGKADDRIRAGFWLRKAAAAGDKNASTLLKKNFSER
jgi:TPR repeat protein